MKGAAEPDERPDRNSGTTIDAFREHNLEMARHVEPLEQVIDCLISAAKSTHVERLQSGKCTIQNGCVLNDAC